MGSEPRTVWKFSVDIQRAMPVVSFDMPLGAEVLCAGEQNESVCIWARVDPSKPVESRDFAIVGTGHPAPDESHAEYVGTAFFFNGSLVLHVFARAALASSGGGNGNR